MNKIKFNQWKPTVFFSPANKNTFILGITLTDTFNDMEQEVLLHFIGLQLLIGMGAVNVGFEKYIREN
jgi:hypothetical protein